MPLGHTRSSVARWAAVTAVVTSVLTSGVVSTITKETPDGASVGVPISRWTTSSGANASSTGTTVAYIDEQGNWVSSGSYTTQSTKNCDSLDTTASGMIVCGTDAGATAIEQLDADSRYVNTSGDTMTGSLTVHGTVSGSTISGTLLHGYNGIFENDVTVRGTLSGAFITPRIVQFQATASGTALAVGSGTISYTVPRTLNGYNLTEVHVRVDNVGVTGTSKFQIYNITDGTTVLSTPASIDTVETSTATAATPYVINTANDDVNENEVLLFGRPTVHSTAAQGEFWTLRFEKP